MLKRKITNKNTVAKITLATPLAIGRRQKKKKNWKKLNIKTQTQKKEPKTLIKKKQNNRNMPFES